MTNRQYNLIDQFLQEIDHGLRTSNAETLASQQDSPAKSLGEPSLSEAERALSANLMRVNHTGEIAAQALYRGQALSARTESQKEKLLAAAEEETDHLTWCQTRLQELNSQPSLLGPLWYMGSFTIGTIAGIAGDRLSLGFVEETEKQVTKHLETHLDALPKNDTKSRAIVSRMREDEIKHAQAAHDDGAEELPQGIKYLMTGIAKIMTITSFRI